MADDFDESAMLEQWTELTADNGPEQLEPVEKESPNRDEAGKFKAKESKEAEPVAEVSQEQPIEQEKPVETVTNDMPATWKQELAAAWPTLPAEVRAEILRREENQRTGIGKYKQSAEAYQRFAEMTRPYEATLRQYNVTAEVAAVELLKADHALRYGNPQQKAQMARQMLADYGIDPAMLGVEGQAPQVDPQIAALQAELAQVRQGQQTEAQRRAQQEQQNLISTLIDFAYERDPLTGNPKIRGHDEYGNPVFIPKAGRENFETLRPYMAALMEADPSVELDEAYQRAAFAHPETRQALLAEQQAQQRAEAEKKAKQAKASSVVNIRSTGSFEPKTAVGSIDDTIREEAQRLGYF